MARQPILDLNKNLYAYELLFRSGPENYFPCVEPDMATSKLIDNSFFVMGLEKLVSNRFAFINMTRSALLSGLVFLLPRDRCVIEVLETVEPDDQVIEACRDFKRRGYRIALDDFIHKPSFEPLLALADYVKVDFMSSSPKERLSYARKMIPRGIRMLAEKVEHPEDFQEGIKAGYTLFQGYFFCKPEMVKTKSLPEYKLNIIRFLQELSHPDLDFDEIESIIKQEVSLSFKLLRLLNSAAMGLQREVTSIRHALVLIGERPLKKWANLIAFSSLSDDKPTELITTCLLRAKFCETLGQKVHMKDREFDLFLTGMFSAVDVLLGRPLEELIEETFLPKDVARTLCGKDTPLYPIYRLALAFEGADWNLITRMTKQTGIPGQFAAETYREAMVWSRRVFQPDLKTSL